MGPIKSYGSASYWNTPRRGWVNLSTGKFTQYPGEFDGPYRGESNEEFQARLDAYDNNGKAE